MNEVPVTNIEHILPRKHVRNTNRVPVIARQTSGFDGGSDGDSDDRSSNDPLDNSEINEPNDGDDSNLFEDYSCPSFTPFQESNNVPTENDQFLWILLWIMNFRTRYNLPETATESLIKFMKLVLKEIGGVDFEAFPNSLYLTKKVLGLMDKFHNFVPCPKCHKLYRKNDVVEFQQDGISTIMKCQHVEYPNSTPRRTRKCGTPLSQQAKLSNNQVTNRPELIYPFVPISQQLAVLYRRPGFESSLRHWTNRSTSNDNTLTDIYDGQIWKTFKESSDQNSPNFFRPEAADTNLGLMLNLDWFQPYEGTTHSTGVIYAAICNLPRDIRFKRENLLVLGVLPRPHEVSLHKINHYLSPIVEDLMLLWDGITLNRTFEAQNEKKIRAALILISCDVPAARKICGHISALVSCHRCEKRANYENNKHNFAGMEDMDAWFISRDLTEHRLNALEWRRCKSDLSRKNHVKETGVRWSELLRLPYFDPIRFLTVDPMHCLFLGIARWIVKRIWVDEGILTPISLGKIQRKMNEIHVPTDLGRIPGKIDCGEGFTNFTADQWRSFITIYATTTLWEFLPTKDRKILTHFVRVCTILVNRIIETALMNEAHLRLIEIVKLIEQHYGRDKITPNLHLSLHLCECSYDYGPLYAFWCFSFERMNGILGK